MKKLLYLFKTNAVLTLVLCIFFACNKEQELAIKSPVNTPASLPISKFDLTEAKTYFSQNARYKTERQDAELFSPIIEAQPEPLWDLATYSSVGEYSVVEVPLKCAKGNLGLGNWKETNKLEGKVSQLDVLNYFSLVFLKDPKGVISAKFMMVKPEKQYAHNPTGLSEMLNCSFDRPAYEFDGATFYFDLAGKYAQGYSYVKGKPYQKISQVSKNALQLRDVECGWLATPVWQTTTSMEYDTELGSWVFCLTGRFTFFYTYQCVNGPIDFSPWVWLRMETERSISGSVSPLNSIALRTLFPHDRICPNSIQFTSNAAPGFPSTQKEALLKDFTIDFRVNGVHVPVKLNYVNLLCENYVPANVLSDHFNSIMNQTQSLINNRTTGIQDLANNAQISAIRALFFDTYNSQALNNNNGIGTMSYYKQDWRLSRYAVPRTCP